MARRSTVDLNLNIVNAKIKEQCRSYIVFCEKMGRKSGKWVSDWNRKDKDGNPTPKNLPSPEEAARMCAILQVTPEEILTEPEDIELVKSLIESQRPEDQKEKPALNEDELDVAGPNMKAVLESIKDLSEAEAALVFERIQKIKESR